MRDLVAVALAGLVLVCATATPALGHGPGHNPTRHEHIMRHGLPDAYRGRVNPLRMTVENLADGRRLYDENCLVCHGPEGGGDGESAADLKPAPSSLTGMYDRPMEGMRHTGPGGHLMHGEMHHHPGITHAEAMGGVNLDAYIFWAVTDGGEPMGSSMPAFAEILSEIERWQILLYIANDFKTVENR